VGGSGSLFTLIADTRNMAISLMERCGGQHVRGSIIDHDNLIVWIVKLQKRVDTMPQRSNTIMGWYNNAHKWGMSEKTFTFLNTYRGFWHRQTIFIQDRYSGQSITQQMLVDLFLEREPDALGTCARANTLIVEFKLHSTQQMTMQTHNT